MHTPAPNAQTAETLIQVARRLIPIAIEIHGEEGGAVEALRREVIDRLEHSPVSVALLGEHSVGKSSLLNALLHTDLLPVKVLPTTALVTEITSGSNTFALRTGQRRTPLDLESYRRLASGDDDSGAAGVLEAYIPFPPPLPSAGLLLVDTPGIHSMNEQHQDITYGYLPRVDCALIVLDAHQGDIPRSVLSFLNDQVLRRDLGKLVFVLNKLDAQPPESHANLLAQVRTTLGRTIEAPRVFPASALGESPGVTPLCTLLVDEVVPARAALVAKGVRTRLRQIAHEIAHAFECQRQALDSDAATLECQLDEILRGRDEIQMELDRLRQRLEADLQRINDAIPSLVLRMLERVGQRAGSELAHVRSLQDLKSQHLQAQLSGWLHQGLEDLVDRELRPRLEAVGETLQSGARTLILCAPGLALDGKIRSLSLPGKVTTDVVIEGLTFAALVVLLPGGWIVALITRVLGHGLLSGFLSDAKSYLSNMVVGFTLSKRIEGIKAHVRKLEPEITKSLRQTLDEQGQALYSQMHNHIDRLMREHERHLRMAQQQGRLTQAEQQAVAARLDRSLDELGTCMAQIG